MVRGGRTMGKRYKLGAGLIVLSLLALLVFWPAGELGRASRLVGRGDYNQAVALLADLSLERPSDKRVQRLFLLALEGMVKEGNPQEAVAWMERVKGTNPREREVRLVYCRALIASARLDQAHIHLSSLVQQRREEDVVRVTLEFIRAAAVEAWRLAVEAWSWLVAVGYNPPRRSFSYTWGSTGI